MRGIAHSWPGPTAPSASTQDRKVMSRCIEMKPRVAGSVGTRSQRALLEADGAHEPTVEGQVGSLERLGPHVLVLEDVSQHAADLRIGRPSGDRLEIGREEADEL
jgi:hypothetical protein